MNRHHQRVRVKKTQRVRITIPDTVVRKLRMRVGSGRFAIASYFKEMLSRRFEQPDMH